MRRFNYTSIALFSALTFSASAIAGHTNTVLEADLSGVEEVNDDDPTDRLPGDKDGSGEAYVFGIDGDLTTLCYQILVDDIQLVLVGDGMAAHIHEGARFENGSVVAVLAGPEDRNAADCLTEGEEGKFPTGESGIVQRILNNPADFYINVHNPEFPAGAVRGTLGFQLEDDHVHTDEGAETDDGEPGAPSNLSFSAYSSSALEVFWDRSTSDSLVINYRVYIDGSLTAEVPGNSIYLDGLSAGESFEVTVEAVDQDNDVSAESQVLTVQTN